MTIKNGEPPRSPVKGVIAVAKIRKSSHRFSAYRKRLRAAMNAKLERAVKRSREDEVRGLARTVGIRTDEYNLQSVDLHSSPKDAFWGGIFLANPIIFNALGVTLIVGAATSLQKSLIISVVATLLLLAVNFLSATVFHRLDDLLRIPAYALTSALLLIPIGRFIVYYYPALATSLGIYLPLAAVCGLVIVRAESYASGTSVSFALADALGNGIGFSLICILVGTLRELFGAGKIGGMIVFSGHSFPSAYLSFYPFLLLGIIAAIWQSIRLARLRRSAREEENQEEGGSDPA